RPPAKGPGPRPRTATDLRRPDRRGEPPHGRGDRRPGGTTPPPEGDGGAVSGPGREADTACGISVRRPSPATGHCPGSDERAPVGPHGRAVAGSGTRPRRSRLP